jgi:RNA polymerase sigma factor (sigma-70 family)
MLVSLRRRTFVRRVGWKDPPTGKNLHRVSPARETVRTAPSVTTLAPSPATAAGEDLAAARLFEEYGERIYRYCLARLRSREEAEDAVQSTFLRVYQALRKGQVPQWEQAWLFKIAQNVCLSRYAASRRRAGVELTQDLDAIEYALPAREHRGDELLGLSDALAGLPPNLRTAILLREWQGLSYAEIARAMGTTVSAVETLIVRARKRLAATLERPRTAIGLLAGLAGRLRTVLLGAGPAKLVAGGALVVATGAAGFGAAVVGSSGSTPAPREPVARTLRVAPAASIPSAAVPVLAQRPSPPAHAFARSAGAPPAVPDRAATPAPTETAAAPVPAAGPAPSPATLPAVPDATDATDAVVPSLPPAPATALTSATDAVSTGLLPQVTVTVPAPPAVPLPVG